MNPKTINCKSCGIEITDHHSEFGAKLYSSVVFCEKCYIEHMKPVLQMRYQEVVNFVEMSISFLSGYRFCYCKLRPEFSYSPSSDWELVLNLYTCFSFSGYESFEFKASGQFRDPNRNLHLIGIMPYKYLMNSGMGSGMDLYPSNMAHYVKKSDMYKRLIAELSTALIQRFEHESRGLLIEAFCIPNICTRCGCLKIIDWKSPCCDDCAAEIQKEKEVAEYNERLALQESEKEAQRLANRQAGYIYLLVSPTGQSKIGFTRNLKSRLGHFRNVFPGIEFHHVIKTDDMRGTEKQLHKRFTDKAVAGEWFNLDATDIDYFKSL
jgi:hypothetical protein